MSCCFGGMAWNFVLLIVGRCAVGVLRRSLCLARGHHCQKRVEYLHQGRPLSEQQPKTGVVPEGAET
eukprot:4509364-Amphidinium_carterae.1